MNRLKYFLPFRGIPVRVTQVLCLPSGDSFPVCPSCAITLEREYQAYCDRCGQRLEWKYFKDAQEIYPHHQVHS